MLKLVQNWFAPRPHPIGVDLGTDCLRLAQVQLHEGEFRLAAAASMDVPSHLRANAPARFQWFAEAVRELLGQGSFRGRQAVLNLPAALMHIQHLRMTRLDEETLRKTLPFEARGKLPVDPGLCMLRHIVAGEIFSEQEPKCEVIVLAAQREMVNQYLEAAARARLDVIGMTVEPKALIDCFANVYRRKTDHEVTNCFVDIGAVSTRVTIARGQEILFARVIPIGGETFTRAVAQALNVGVDQARLLRVQSAASVAGSEQRDGHAPDAAAVESAQASAGAPAQPSAAAPGSTATPAPSAAPQLERSGAETSGMPPTDAASPRDRVGTPDANRLEEACLPPLNRLVEELNLCRRYHEATFPNKPVDRLIFVGGEARQKWLCQHIARQMQLAAQVGDPLVRMSRTMNLAPESGIDRRLPQPSWAVAVGLSMGPRRPAGSDASTERASERVAQRGAA